MLIAMSCSLFESGEEEIVAVKIARVGNEYLYLHDVAGVVPEESAPEDSTLIIDNYIQTWIKEKLILQRAELNLDETKHDFKKQLEDYRKSLIIYTYEKEYIKQHLDTLVTIAEIESFYETNKQNLKLRDDIVKVKYLKVLKSAPKVNQIRKLYTSKKEKDQDKLKELAHQYSEKFHLDDELWIKFDELKKEVPIQVADTRDYLKKFQNIEVEDSLSYYFVKVTEYKLKNDESPLPFETDNIRSIILNKRKLKLINEIKSGLYEDAFLNKKIEIYKQENES